MKRLICLDRDGVINKNPRRFDYIKKPYQFRFVPGARKAIRELTTAGFDIVIISNQAGIAKGIFTKDDLRRIDEKMYKAIEASGGKIRKSFYCIHHPEANCHCRKPKDGHIRKAAGRSAIDKKNSYFIGDTERDSGAGKKFGLRTIAVLSGYCGRNDIRQWKVQPDFIATDLLAAAKVILKNNK